MRRVRIKRLPQAKAGGAANGYTNTVPEQFGNFGGADVNENRMQDTSTSRTLKPVAREDANLEAEKGEVAYGDINGDNFAETYVIGGKRHGSGGTPLNLPANTFIFSDFNQMKIKDPKVLAMFGKVDKKGKSKRGYTPAELAKQYDINKYREILQSPNSDKKDIATAELMIQEFQMKLGALALAQESLKNFEQGIPQVARPYMEKMGLTDQDILPEEMLQEQQQQVSQGQGMMQQEQIPPMARFGGGLNPMPNVELNKFIPKYQSEGEVFPEKFKTDKETIDYLKDHPNLSDPTQWSQEEKDWWEKNNEYYHNKQKFERVISPTPNESMTPEERAKYDREFQRRMMHRMDWGKPTPGYLQPSMDAIDECPCMQKVPMPLADGTIIMEDRCIPCEQMNTAQNGGSLNRMPLVNLNRFIPQAQTGLSLLPETMFSTNDLNDTDNASYNQIGLDPNSEEFTNSPEYVQKGNKSFHYNPSADLNAYGSNQEAEDIYNRTFGDRVYDLFHQRKKPRVSTKFQTGGESTPEGYHMMPEGYMMPNSEMNYGNSSYRSGGQLDKYQGGGAKKEGEIVINRSDYKTQAEYKRAKYFKFNEAEKANKMLVVIGNDGKRRKITRTQNTFPEYSGTDIDSWGGDATRAEAGQYQALVASVKNPIVRAEIIKQTLAALDNKESYKAKDSATGQPGKYGKTWSARGYAKPTDDQIIASFLKHQERNLKLSANDIKSKVFKDSGRGLKTAQELVNKKIVKTLEEGNELIKTYKEKGWTTIQNASKLVGVPLEASGKERALQQATFHGYATLANNVDKDFYTDQDKQYALRSFADNVQIGASDETGQRFENVSPIDDFSDDLSQSIYGNTTAGHLAGIMNYGYDEEELEEEKDDADVDIEPNTPRGPAPWWLQDEINIAGNIMDRSRIKKYMPWAPGVDLEEIDPTFTDPRFDANLHTAGAASMMEGLSQFTGPQAASARASSIQGQLAGNTAEAIQRHNTQNVGIANQFEQANVGVRNQERMLEAQKNQRLYDQNTIANQQYDNSMAQSRAQGRGLYTGAITNRWKTDALNQMYPQYSVDPSVGGQMDYTGEKKKFTGEGTAKTYDEWFQQYIDQGIDHSVAQKAARDALAKQAGYAGSDVDNAMSQYEQDGGYVMGSNVFPFMF